MRNLFRQVFLAGGYEESKDGGEKIRRTRVSVAEFETAMKVSMGGAEASRIVDRDEVECFLANMIYKVSEQDHTLLALLFVRPTMDSY